jgi:hypothetical protein
MTLRISRPVSGVTLAILTVSAAALRTQQPAPPADADTPVFTLHCDAAIITMLIKPDKTADFELVLDRLKEALRTSDKAERRAQAAGWRIFKSAQMAQGNAVYIMRIDPVVKGQEYDITRLIAEAFPVEVQELFQKYKDAFAGRGITELSPFMSMQP